jgi:hypothetical protein
MLLIADENRPALRPDSGIDDDDVQRIRWKIWRRLSNSQRAIKHIEGIHGVAYIHDLNVRVDAENHTLHRADKMVIHSEIGRQRD